MALTLDASGDVWVLWYQAENGAYSVWVQRYDSQTGQWEAAERLDDSSTQVTVVDIGGLADGSLLAVWIQGGSLQTRRFDPEDQGWDSAESLGGGDGQYAWDGLLTTHGGKGLVVWRQWYRASDSKPTTQSVLARRYDAEVGWSEKELVSQSDDVYRRFPQAAISADGSALVVWEVRAEEGEASHYHLYAGRFDPQTRSWSPEERIDAGAAGEETEVYRSQVAMDESGRGLVVWAQSFGHRYDIWARRLAADGRWGPAQPIEDDGAGDSRPLLRMTPDGRAMALWNQNDGWNEHVWAASFIP